MKMDRTVDKGYGGRVPRRVDHEERRRRIADALVRTATARELHAAGMREVAAEAQAVIDYHLRRLFRRAQAREGGAR